MVRIVSLLPSATEILFELGSRRRCRRCHVRVQLSACRPFEADRVDVCAPRGPRPSRHRCRRQGAHGRWRGPVPARSRHLRRSRSRPRRDAGSLCRVRRRRLDGRRRDCLSRMPGPGAHARSDDARRGARLDPRCRRRDWYRHGGRSIGRAFAGPTRRDGRARVAGGSRPPTLVLEWTDPAFTAGHWVPDLVTGAGGECLLGRRGQRSEGIEWSTIASSGAEVVIVAPCGYRLDGAAVAGQRRRSPRRAAPWR